MNRLCNIYFVVFGCQKPFLTEHKFLIKLFAGLKPIYSIFISTSGSKPESLIKFRASSLIFTGSPISRTNISPPFAIAPACSTSCTASGIVIKNLVISGWVTVTGPPLSICFLNSGTTLPLLPSTFPNLVFVCSSSVLVNTVSKRLGTSLNLSDSESSLPLTPYIGVVSVEGTIMDSNSTTSFLSNGYNHKETLKLIEDMKIQQATKAFFCM